jgi:chemotaxis signal transduction protein
MAIYSPLRSRRLAAQQTEATQRLITFRLGQENFALSLDRVQKVTTLDSLYGDPQGTGISLTTHQGQELRVIDVGNRIFGEPQQIWAPTADLNQPAVTTHTRHLLILQPELLDPLQVAMSTAVEQHRLVGLPIDSAPSIQSMPLSAFRPIPDIYRNRIHCVSAMSNVLPVNALLRKRAFRMSGTAAVTAAETDLTEDQPSIFLLDATSIVGG